MSLLTRNAHSRLPCQAEHSSVVKAQYDYNAVAEGELSVNEDQLLMVFGSEEDGWLLVQDQVDGRIGYVPGNYVQVSLLVSLLTDVHSEGLLK